MRRSRAMLLENDMEVGSAEAVGTNCGTSRKPFASRPGLGRAVQIEGSTLQAERRIRLFGVKRGRELFGIERKEDLEETRGSRGPLQVAQVALDRAQGHAAARRCTEHLAQGLRLDLVADFRARSVSFDERHGRGGHLRSGPRSLHGESLSHWIRRGDALPTPVARRTEATNDAIDLVAVSFGIGEAFEEHDHAPLAHDESVCTIGKGSASRGAERADFGELHERRRRHVVVHATSEDGVTIARGETVHRCRESRETGRAGCVGDEARSPQVQDVRNSPGHHVRELARHGVFGDRRAGAVELDLPLLEETLSRLFRQSAEGVR